jgi:hypothetical protein
MHIVNISDCWNGKMDCSYYRQGNEYTHIRGPKAQQTVTLTYALCIMLDI